MLLQPSYTTDLTYPAYQDRLTLKSVAHAGVVGAKDYEVTAGSGLQVNINLGSAFVGQTLTKQESSNVFYNGLYQVPNTTEASPSNTASVNASNPTFNQIILRVYDSEELGLSGSSFAKLEWLNGLATPGATLDNRNGAALLPQSSLRLADVLVKKGASNSSEFEIRDRRPWALGLNSFRTVVPFSRTSNVYAELALGQRVEVSPERELVLTYTNPFVQTFQCNMEFQFMVDGVGVAPTFEGMGGASINTGGTFAARWIPTLGAGSHLISAHIASSVNGNNVIGAESLLEITDRPTRHNNGTI